MESSDLIERCLQAATVLNAWHKQFGVHGDVRPESFTVDLATGLVSGIKPPRSDIVRTTSPIAQLRYESPEQVGRLQDRIDHRSDLYSLGIIFYEWITGCLPFDSVDPLEIVYCNLSVVPAPPINLRKNVSPALSGMTMKLLEKQPGRRYASTEGLIHDLKEVLVRIQAGNGQEFILGSYDAVTQFRIHDKLYGREVEIQCLCDLYREAALGKGSLCLISGYSGIGKTSLVYALRDKVRAGGGLLAFGKYDQFRRLIPCSAFLEMFQKLLRHVLSGTVAEVNEWRERYLAATGDNAMVAADLLPELAHLIGKQPSPIPLTDIAAQHRFREVFTTLFQLFIPPERPLLVFLDDLQWADFASISLIQHLLSGEKIVRTLFIGAYRDNEVDAAHPLHDMVAELRKRGVLVSEINVGPIHPDHVLKLLEDACSGRLKQGGDLVRLVMDKTGGNPFFTRQFITELHQSRYLFYKDDETLWDWSRDAVAAAGKSENVIDLLSRRMGRLPQAAQDILRYAACAGHEFKMDLIAETIGISPSEALVDLAPVLQMEMIVPMPGAGQNFRFVHDRVQQAAHSLPGEPPTEAIHLALGRKLLAGTAEVEIEEQLFTIANHVNHGIDIIPDLAERREYAVINLRAGLKAKGALAYQAAASYFDAGIGFLMDTDWHDDFQLHFKLNLNCAEIADLMNNLDRFESLCVALEARCRTPLEHYEVCYRRIKFASHHARLMDVMEHGRRGLVRFGINIPALDNPDALMAMFREQLADFRSQTADRSIDELEQLPQSADPEHMAILSLVESISESALILSAQLFACVAAIGAARSIRFGNTGLSPMMYSILCTVLIAQFRSFADVKKIAPVYLRLIRRSSVSSYDFGRCMTYHIWNVNHYTSDFETVLPLIRENLTESLKSHDNLYAAYCWVVETHAHFIRGYDLDDAIHSGSCAYKMCKINSIPMHLSFSEPITAAVHALKGDTHAIDDLNWTDFDEKAFLEAWAAVPMTIAIWKIGKITVCGFAGQYQRIIELAEGINDDHPRSHMLNIEWNFWLGVACAVMARQSDDPSGAHELIKKLDAQILLHDELCKNAHAANFTARFLFLKAERARCHQQADSALADYRSAAQSAADNRFTLLEGLCWETLADFQLEQKLFDVSRVSLENALRCYAKCHANALLPRLQGRLSALGVRSAESADAFSINPIDALAVVRAVRTISSEVNLDRLLQRLLAIAVEFSGAESGVILSQQQNELKREASAGRKLDLLPESLIRYGFNTFNTLCPAVPVSDAISDTDPYIQAQRPLSLYCRPLGKPGPGARMLYLEHRTLSDVFRSRFETIEMIATQAGISIDNAYAYEELRRSKEKAELYLRTVEMMVVAISDNATVQLLNRKGCETLGYQPGELEGRDWFKTCLPPEEYERTVAVYKQIMGGHLEEASYFQNTILTRGGERRLIAWHNTIITDDTGRISGTLSCGEDITERKQAEQREQELREKLERAARMESLGVLAGGVAHDLNNVLGPLVGLPDMVIEYIERAGNPADPEHADTLESMRAMKVSALRAVSVVSDLVVMGRRGQFQLAPVDVKSVVEQLLDSKQIKAIKERRPDINMAKQLPDESLWCLGSDSRLMRVLANLLGNAAEAIAGTGTITVRAGRRAIAETCHGYEEVPAGDYIVVEVTDTGCGMEPQTIARIFEPFFSTKAPSERSGSGLGLSVVHGLVKDHAGFLDVKSVPGKGTTFTVYLPAATPVDDQVACVQDYLPEGHERILVVDDEPGQQFLARRQLEKLGYDVQTASCGEDAVAMFEAARREGMPMPFDLVLMDMIMPGGADGLSTCKAILELFPQQKILIMSGHAPEQYEARVKELGIGWIPKPCHVEALARTLRARLERRP